MRWILPALLLLAAAAQAQAQTCPNIQIVGPYQMLITGCPTSSPTPAPTASPSPSPSPAPTASPSPSPTPSPVPTASPTPVPTSTPTPVPTATPTPVGGLTGSTAPMQVALACTNAAGTKVNCPGVFNATTTAAYNLDGQGLVNGQLLDDAQAAAMVTSLGTLPPSSVETTGSQTQTADFYYQNSNPTNYAAELVGWNKQTVFPTVVAARVDGACPLHNPNTAQANAWAAFKWGLNPKLGLGEATQEDQFNVNAPGDVNSCADTGHDMWGGCSTGWEQIADAGANHGWSGLLPPNKLAAESACFHFDFFYMHYYAEYYGLFLEWGQISAGQITQAIQYWCGPSCSNYSTNVLNAVNNASWVNQYYGGVPFPIAPATGTAIPQL